MYPKAYRWVAEMHEIADFLGPEDPAASLFEAAAGIFAKLSEHHGRNAELATMSNHTLGLDDQTNRTLA